MRLILYLNNAKDMNQHQLQIILLNLNGNIIKKAQNSSARSFSCLQVVR